MVYKISDVFLESKSPNGDGGKAFAESPGRERTSGGMFPSFQRRSIAAQKFIRGWPPVDPTDGGRYEPTNLALPREYYKNLRRRFFSKMESMTASDGGYWDKTVTMAINPDTGVPSMGGYWLPTGPTRAWDLPLFGYPDYTLIPTITDSISAVGWRRHGVTIVNGATVNRETTVGGEVSLEYFITKVNNVIRGVDMNAVRNSAGQAITWNTTWKRWHTHSGTTFNEFSGPVRGAEYFDPAVDFSGYTGALGSEWVGIDTSASHYSGYFVGDDAWAIKSQVRGFVGPYVIIQGYFGATDNVQAGLIDAGTVTNPTQVIDIPFPGSNSLPPDPAFPDRPLYTGVMNYIVRG